MLSSTSGERKVFFEKYCIEYTLIRKNVKNINLRLNGEGKITVSCSNLVSVFEIDNFVLKNAPKIISFKEKQNQRKSESHFAGFGDGEHFYIFGEKKEIINIPSTKYKAYILNKNLILEAPADGELSKKKKSIDLLLKDICSAKVYDIIVQFSEIMEKENIPYPQITFRKMKTRWGSCFSSGNKICINTLLACSPICCLEAVVLHELVHFVHPNHSSDFYNCLYRYMPDYRIRKKQLTQYEGFFHDLLTN